MYERVREVSVCGILTVCVRKRVASCEGEREREREREREESIISIKAARNLHLTKKMLSFKSFQKLNSNLNLAILNLPKNEKNEIVSNIRLY